MPDPTPPASSLEQEAVDIMDTLHDTPYRQRVDILIAFATRQREQERQVTARRCLNLVGSVRLPGGGYADEDGRIADAIRAEFGLTEEP